MYLLRKDYANAANYYGYLATHFPAHKNAAAAHWRAGWLNYRQGLYADAARMFDEQIKLFPNATETAAALYWRGRLYEMQDNNRRRRRPTIAPFRGFTSTSFMRRWRGSGCRRWASRSWSPTPQVEPIKPRADSSPVRHVSSRQSAHRQGAPGGQRRPERLHRAGACRRS